MLCRLLLNDPKPPDSYLQDKSSDMVAHVVNPSSRTDMVAHNVSPSSRGRQIIWDLKDNLIYIKIQDIQGYKVGPCFGINK